MHEVTDEPLNLVENRMPIAIKIKNLGRIGLNNIIDPRAAKLTAEFIQKSADKQE